MEFRLHAPYAPTGDQPQAIDALVREALENIERVRIEPGEDV